MGFLQSNVGYRRCDGETRLKRYGKAVTVISLTQAETVLSVAAALDVKVTLLSVPFAAASVGPGWFEAIVRLAAGQFPSVCYEAVLDCGSAPGDALAALRHGVNNIRYAGVKQAAIAEIARQYGSCVIRMRPESLDIAEAQDEGQSLITACRSWLSS